jgi:hypothetical protein
MLVGAVLIGDTFYPGSWLAAWQSHREYRALARLARHGHVAAHHARELAGDGKAQPRPAVAPSSQGIGLGEILEQFCLLADLSALNERRPIARECAKCRPEAPAANPVDARARIQFHKTPSLAGKNREDDRRPGGIAAKASCRSMMIDRRTEMRRRIVRANHRALGRACRVRREQT